ncbi:MAG TPA: UDP-glucose 4-epimerase GalE [Candidatus Binatia bacterium]|nr:UDP-glucose 4-epimerase GalE [Candidatus Binatia bacterium]
MKVLIVGGAGYIGSHMALLLGRQAAQVIVLDDLSSGDANAVLSGRLVQGSIEDTGLLDRLFAEEKFDGVMHFASFIQVGESVQHPAKYYRNNVTHTINLLDAMVRHRVKNFIFSSTAAIFGQPEYVPIDEAHPKQPINPYGRSKWMVEQVLRDYDSAYGLRSVCLRYFNAAGADPEARIGETHEPETHLIPLLLQVASGRRQSAQIFGDDYDTPDGTCIRDYIHVLDLATVHSLALAHLISGGASAAYNLGNGNGFSVRQVIDAVRQVTMKPVPVIDAARRAGDPARLVADATLARKHLGWTPLYPDLSTIVSHAWNWEKKIAGV